MENSKKTLTVALRTNNRYFSKVYDDRPFLIHEPLFRWKPRKRGWIHYPSTLSDLEPRLAEWYDVSRDGLIYTVYLRKGVKSIFGNDLTAEDIKWSWDRAFSTRGVGRFTGRVAPMRNKDNVSVKDKHVIEFRLDKPNVTFPHFLASKYIPMLDSTEVRKHTTEDDPWAVEWLSNNHASYGPFIIESYDEKEDIVKYRRNKDYWCPGLPRIDNLILKGIPSPDDRVAAVRSGEVDVALSLPVDGFRSFKGNEDLYTMAFPSHDPMMLQMNCKREPFINVLVRRAVCYAVPYEKLKEDIWKEAARSYKSPFVDVCMGYTEKYFPYYEDPDMAKKLLSEAGITKDINVNMVICGEILAEIKPTAEAIKTALARIGISIEIEDLNEQGFRGKSFKHDFDLLLDPHTHQVSDAYYISLDDYGDEKWGIENMNQYYDPEVFRLQQECLKATTEGERVEYVHEMQKVILEGAPQAYLFQINSLVAARKEVTGLEWDVNGRMFYQNAIKIL